MSKELRIKKIELKYHNIKIEPNKTKLGNLVNLFPLFILILPFISKYYEERINNGGMYKWVSKQHFQAQLSMLT